MKEEKYSIKRPEHIVIGDPWYFETVKGKRLAELTVDYKPPTEFAAAVSLISVLFVVQKNDQKLKTTFGHLIREA